MILTVHSQHFRLTDSTRQYVADSLLHPLEAVWDKQGTELDVSLRDLRGGDKQGLDKECRCVARLAGGPTFVITEISENMWKSIHLARKRLLRRARQYREHRQDDGRHHRKHFLADVADTKLFRRYPRSEQVHGAQETIG